MINEYHQAASPQFRPRNPIFERHTLQAAMRLLLAEPRHLPEAVSLGVALLPVPERTSGPGASAPGADGPEEAARLVGHLAELADLLVDRPVLATRTAELVARRFRSYHG
jgi:hypothetical protein